MENEKLIVNLYESGKGIKKYSPSKIDQLYSTHYDQEKRLYEIWDDEYFVVRRHEPWIDSNILESNETIQKILDYSQEDNRIVEVYHISSDMIITKYYKGYYPCLIKSSVLFYSEDEVKNRSNAHARYFNNINRAKKFYKEVLSEYRNFHSETGCYFKDDAANNYIVNHDHSDFMILDFGCLIYDPNKEVRVRDLMDAIGGVNGNDDLWLFGREKFTQLDKIMGGWKTSVKTTFQMHVMWYESRMLGKTLDSLQNALQYANGEVGIQICLNGQTYLERPIEGTPEDMFQEFIRHPVLKNANIVRKTDDDPFYNIADWRREVYSKEGYTVCGESDCLIPYDLFFILENLQLGGQLLDPHTLSLSSRKMWDNTWEEVEFNGLEKYTYQELEGNPLHRKTTIDQETLDEINDEQDSPEIVLLNKNKVDGALFILSEGIDQFIPDDMHFAREDTCTQLFLEYNNIPQYHIKNRLKGHNYIHPLKRLNTKESRDTSLWKKFEQKSINAMNKFLAKYGS